MDQQTPSDEAAASSSHTSSANNSACVQIGVDIFFTVMTGLLINFTTMVVWCSAPKPIEEPLAFACFLLSLL